MAVALAAVSVLAAHYSRSTGLWINTVLQQHVLRVHVSCRVAM